MTVFEKSSFKWKVDDDAGQIGIRKSSAAFRLAELKRPIKYRFFTQINKLYYYLYHHVLFKNTYYYTNSACSRGDYALIGTDAV